MKKSTLSSIIASSILLGSTNVFAVNMDQKISLRAALNICQVSCSHSARVLEVGTVEQLLDSNGNGLYPSQDKFANHCASTCQTWVKNYRPEIFGE